MRVVIQRVSKASVTIGGDVFSSIGHGMLILLGIEVDDTEEDIPFLINKITRLRIFNDERGVMNLSCTDVKGEYLVVSQFTLHASVKKGNRPSYIRAARPEQAIPLYEAFIEQLSRESGTVVKTGSFGADMQVELINAGPVTILIDSKETGGN
jgi:D-aminoacyl-tRNA deacylase